MTDDDSVTGARTNLITDKSGLSKVDSTFETVERPAFYLADATHAGKRLFLSIAVDYNGDGNALGRVDNVVLKVRMPLSTWKDRYFSKADLMDSTISGNLEDPDRDGAANLLEFVQNTNPRSANDDGDTSSTPNIQLNGDQVTLLIVESKQLDGIGISTTFQGAENLAGPFINLSAISIKTVSEDDSTRTMDVELPVVGDRYFYRVEYSF